MPAAPRFVARTRYAAAALAWMAFVVYGSLVPLDFRPRQDAWASFAAIRYLELGVGSRADWIANILLYLVLAYLATAAVWRARLRSGLRRAAVGAVVGACLALALTIEFAQLFFPPRTVSINDLVAESIGTLIGCAAWFFAGPRLRALWRRFRAGGRHSVSALLVLYTIGYVAFSLFPYDFLISAVELKDKLAQPGALGFGPGRGCTAALACGVKLLTESVLVVPLGVLLALTSSADSAQTADRAALRGFAVGVGGGLAIEAAQVFLASGSSGAISVLTRGIGATWGVMLARGVPLGRPAIAAATTRRALLVATPFYLALLLALNGVLPPTPLPLWDVAEKLAALRFLPFYYHYYTSETAALHSLLAVAGSYAPIGVATTLVAGARTGRAALATVLIAAGLSLTVETLRLFDAGNRPDPTNFLIAPVSAWLFCRLAARLLAYARDHANAATPPPPAPRAPVKSMPPLLAVAAPLVLVAVVAATSAHGPRPPPDQAEAHPTLPPPEALPPVALPRFNAIHPRLPHPSPDELQLLEARYPAYLAARRKRAADGTGVPDAVILAAFAEPRSLDLAALHGRLLAVHFTERGDTEVKLLAQAYDWLHTQWATAQREALRDKLAEGCAYVIDYIRKERLSPYNVILYNSPLQALMACSIALYRDDPRGEGFMAFTHDLWTRRVLPVWRQVFGRNGGWHEGGEYLAIGIGQAIYTLPAMWRAATGEDLFATEPGLRGFLDFLIYRAQPDGSQFRWGDGSFFGRGAPDAVPLALLYGHAAAYSQLPVPNAPTPTAWPWGPLTNPALKDPGAIGRLPPSRVFDGIGMVVARSDWSTDATHVSFKAGDNFWSHSHLDQGAFTIFKGGPLAIDSGAYGPHYGSDHHLNYSYQTIAHNTLTVTDPDDNAPLETREGPRPIANDGGQRRVGSGWGLEPAPIDLAEWQARRELYHTGKLVRTLERDELTVAVADLTPAYTNSGAGEAPFSHRTRRVERAWRIFAYDRADDVVVVYDDVRATSPALRKRWLLHAIDEPRIDTGGFTVVAAPQDRPGRSGGRLTAYVVLPRERFLTLIGGRGFEFFVDGHNYNVEGKLWDKLRKGENAPEPGAWRIELSPAREAADNQFLVVLLPTRIGETPPHQIRPLQAGNEVGCEIRGPRRTTRWWFTPGQLGVRIEVEDGGAVSLHHLTSGPGAPPD